MVTYYISYEDEKSTLSRWFSKITPPLWFVLALIGSGTAAWGIYKLVIHLAE